MIESKDHTEVILEDQSGKGTKQSGEEGTQQSAESKDHTTVTLEDQSGEGTKQSGEEGTPQSVDRNKWTGFAVFQWIVLVCFVGLLLATLTVGNLKIHVIWGLELWKWCVLVLVIFCSGLFSKWMMNFAVLAITWKHGQHVKVIYLVYGLRTSVQLLVWFALVLGAWGLLFDVQGKGTEKTTRILNGITRGLAASLLGAFLWFLKSLLVKFVGSKFQGNRFFSRIRKVILQQHIVEVLARQNKGESCLWTISGFVSATSTSGKGLIVRIAADDDKENKPRTSNWIIKEFDSIRKALVSVFGGCGSSYKIVTIKSRKTARDTAGKIFDKLPKDVSYDRNRDKKTIWGVSKDGFLSYFHNSKEIDDKEVVGNLFSKTESNGKEIIEEEKFKKWLVAVYKECIELPKTMKDDNTAIEELNRVLSGIVLVVIVVVWLLVMEFLTTKELFFISSQLLLLGFIFSNTVKTVFEAMVFVFVTHPIDVHDQCIVDGQNMTVAEMNLLTTVFQNQNNEFIYYPNSVLATKPIINIYRTQKRYKKGDADTVSFVVDASTTVEQIKILEARIPREMDKRFVDLKMVVEDFDDKDKIKVGLYFTHILNLTYEKKKRNRSIFILKLKEILEELQIKYYSLPRDQAGKS